MLKLGRDPRAHADFLRRGAATPGSHLDILLSDHPGSRERAAAIEAIARAAPNQGGSAAPALLTVAEWSALKRICQARPAPASTPPATPDVQRQQSSDAPGAV
jgi:hypothetical protein